MPVFAPSAILVDDSMYAVPGDIPRRAAIEMQNASTQYADDVLEITRGIIHDIGETDHGVHGTSSICNRRRVGSLLNSPRDALTCDNNVEEGNKR